MAYQCVRCGLKNVSFKCPNCAQIEAINEQTKILKKQTLAAEKAAKASLAAQNQQLQPQQSDTGIDLVDRFSDGYRRGRSTGESTSTGGIFTLIINICIVWPLQILKVLVGFIIDFERSNPVLFRKIAKLLALTIIIALSIALITQGAQSLYHWADTYKFGAVFFWIVAAIIIGLVLLVGYIAIFDKNAREGWKKSYEEGHKNGYEKVRQANDKQEI